MRVLVTGAMGFIGSHVVDALLAAGHEVTGLDDSSSGRNKLTCACVEHCDVADPAGMSWLFEAVRPEYVVHLAAQPSLIRSVEDPLLDARTNVLGTLVVLQEAARHRAGVVMASTGAVYDADGELPYREGGRLRPTSPYGISKLAGEYYVHEFAARTGLPGVVLRFGNVYGPRQVPVGENQLIPRAIAGLLGQAPFAIYGDGLHRRDYVYVADVALAIVMVAEKRGSGTLNVATGIGTSTLEVVSRLADLLGRRGRAFDHVAEKRWEHEAIILDSRQAEERLGWTALTPLGLGLRLTAETYQVGA